MKFSLVFVALLLAYATSDECRSEDSNEVSAGVPKNLEDLLTNLPSALTKIIKGIAPNFSGMFTRTIKCLDDTLENLNLCNFNTSYDPFTYIKACAKDTKLDKLATKLLKLVPGREGKSGVLVTEDQSRCFNPADFLLKPIIDIGGILG